MDTKFNENLKCARENQNMSQKEAAEAIGVAKSTYSLYESGKREPNIATIRKLADLMKVSADELLGLNQADKYPETIAAHFNGSEFTEEERNKINDFAAYVKSQRK